MGFFGGGSNYSDSSESDSDAEDEREALSPPTQGLVTRRTVREERRHAAEG